jgi:spermidine synthase
MRRAVGRERLIQQFEGTYHPSIQVCERGDVRFMRFGPRGGWQGAVKGSDWSKPVFAYQRAFLSLLKAIGQPERFLSLGVGTGTSMRNVQAQSPDTELYGIEIDQHVVDAAIAFFDSPSHKEANYWIGDGVAFLCNVDLSFDFIFVDAYLTDQIYNPCLDPAFATVLSAALVPDGVAVCNLITRFPNGRRVAAFLAAAGQLFKYVAVLPVGPPVWGVEQNALAVLTDSEDVIKEWKRSIPMCEELSRVERVLWPLRMKSMNR